MERVPFHECWEWNGPFRNDGYGLLVHGKKPHRAHRVSWEMHNGPIPEWSPYTVTSVLHKCDNRSCVRPDHLFIGTQEDNIRDMNAKVRNGRAKLTPEQALEIRRAAVRPRGGITELAVRYRVSRCQIARIRSGSKWPSL